MEDQEILRLRRVIEQRLELREQARKQQIRKTKRLAMVSGATVVFLLAGLATATMILYTAKGENPHAEITMSLASTAADTETSMAEELMTFPLSLHTEDMTLPFSAESTDYALATLSYEESLSEPDPARALEEEISRSQTRADDQTDQPKKERGDATKATSMHPKPHGVPADPGKGLEAEKGKETTSIVQQRPANGMPQSRTYRVQLSSVSNEKAAHEELARLSKRIDTQLKGTNLAVVKADVGERGYVYRIVTEDLPSLETALNICQGLKAQGKEALVVRR